MPVHFEHVFQVILTTDICYWGKYLLKKNPETFMLDIDM